MFMSLLGGLMIGAAALLLYGTLGRIAGISGIAFGTVWSTGSERAWRLLFLLGVVAGGLLAALAAGTPAVAQATGPAALLAIVSGVLVGLGTHMGNGCTSGHGVCGLAQFSPRSLASVLVFMGVGMLSATLLLPVLS